MSQINQIFGESRLSSSTSEIGSSRSLEGSEQNLFSASWIPNSRTKIGDAWESLPDYYDLGFVDNGKIIHVEPIPKVHVLDSEMDQI